MLENIWSWAVFLFEVWVLLVALIVALFYLYTHRKASLIVNAEGKRMPGPGPFWLFGALFGQRENPIFTVARMARTYGKLYQFFLGPIHGVVIADAESAKVVLLHLDRFPKEKEGLKDEAMAMFVGKNVAASDGAEWFHQRRILNSAFANTANFMPVFAEKVNYCVNVLLKTKYADQNKLVPVNDVMQQFTIDTLGTAAFGFEFNAMKGQLGGYVEDYHRVVNEINMMAVVFPFLKHFKTAAQKKRMQSVDRLLSLFYSVIETSRNRLKSDPEAAQSILSGNTRGATLLDMMLASNMTTQEEQAEATNSTRGTYTMSDESLKDNVAVLFLAGHDTTSNALSYALYTLGQETEVQEKLYQEIIATLGSDSSVDATYDQLCGMQYLNGFIKEVLRKYPPLGSVGNRTAANDDVIGGYFVPKGATVSISIQAIHYDPDLYEDPETLKPERWVTTAANANSTQQKHYHSHAWLPFGGGPRTCVGNNFSMLEQRMFLVKLLQVFRVEKNTEYKLKLSVTFLPKPEGATVYLRAR